MCIEQKEIEKYIFRKIAANDKDVIHKTMDSFGLTENDVKKYINDALYRRIIEETDECEAGYKLTEQKYSVGIPLHKLQLSEDKIFADEISEHLRSCNKDAFRIWQYVCAEMLNNAIEHSQGSNISIDIYTTALYSKVIIVDDGVGTFHTLTNYMAECGWSNPQPEDALVELYKGKFTSNAVAHSGEGIFFSSKMLDDYVLWSDSLMYLCGNKRELKLIQSHLLAYASRLSKIGTMICMVLENDTSRKIEEVFDMYTDIDMGFTKTHIPIKEACITGEPVARSQARRICNRLEEFKEVILDFQNVEYIGQGFADEIFRVYATANPNILLRPINMVPVVEKMIRHVGRGTLASNVVLNR